jgi:hypothetical protein
MALTVERNRIGLLVAEEWPWRVIRHAHGCHSENRCIRNGRESSWRIAGPGEMPADVRERLLAALKVDAADEPQVCPRKGE